jgi:hypothetical protein
VPDSGGWRYALIGGGWAALLVLCAVLGYKGFQHMSPAEPGDKDLVRDLRLIENKRYYDVIEDLDFLRQLDHPDLFGEDNVRP